MTRIDDEPKHRPSGTEVVRRKIVDETGLDPGVISRRWPVNAVEEGGW
jgi:hypothetical protein